MATIRHARPEDASAIAAIWNPLIRDTAVTFSSAERTPDEIRALMAGRAEAGHPWLLAERPEGLAGFATYAQFRAGGGYARTMEHTIILGAPAAGRGIGSALMERLLGEARGRGVHSMIGAVSAENQPALAFHRRLGFVEVGRIPEAGRKFDRWIDLVLVRRALS